MEFTNILGKIKASEKKEKENFFALEIESDTVKSAVWEVSENKPEVIKIGTVEEWDDKKEDSFLSAVDRTISSASAGVTPEPDSIIFGLPEDWASKEQISNSKKKVLKKICEKLELKPLGFVVTIEALITFLKKKQGTPPSAIFIRLAESEICVTMVSLGKVLGSKTVVRSQDLAADVKEGLARFKKVENFPPRMILFNSLADFEEAKQQLISYEWDKELPFLHFPKVESLAVETSIRAIAVSGGSEVAKSLGFEIKEEEEKEKVTEVAETDERKAALKTQKSTETTESSAPSETSDSSVLRKKHLDQGKDTETQLKSKESADKKDAADELGFIAGEDVLKAVGADLPAGRQVYVSARKRTEEKEKPSKEEREEIKIHRPPSKNKFAFIGNFLRSSKNLVQKIPAAILSLPRIRGSLRSPFSGLPTIGIFIAFIFIGLFIGGFLIYWRLPKAKVTVFVKPEVLEKDIGLTVSSNQSSLDTEDKIIPGEMQTIEVSGSETISTSGKKLIGDEASGQVTIFNKTDSSKSFEAGAILIGPDSLRFELTEDVEIASKSAETTGEGESITYGKADAKIEAGSIGPEYNVGGGTEFSFKDFGTGSFSAKTNDGLSGGTSREIKAVSEEDQEALLTKLTEKLEAQAARELEEKLPSGMKVFEKGVESEVKNKKFNHDVDDEADKLKLDLSLKTSALSFAKEDLDTLLFHVLADQIPDNFELRPTDLNTEIKEVDIGDEEVDFDVQVKAELLPRFELDKLAEDLVGKYPAVAEETLSALPNFVKATIEISPKLPGKLGTLPRLKQNIKVEVRIAN